MRTIMTLILLILPILFSNSRNKILVMMKPLSNLQLYTVVWNECRGCDTEEIKAILDCIKNRVEHKDFPDSLDSVLIQPFQFVTKKEGKKVTKEFIEKVDSLWKKPVKYPYLYFRSEGYEYSKWMKVKKWFKPKSFKHEFTY